MRNIWRVALVGGLLATPSAAQAQPSNPMMYCVPGSPFACFGLAFEMTGHSGTFWLQNLQGSVSDDATPWGIRAFSLSRVNEDAGEHGLLEGYDQQLVGAADLAPEHLRQWYAGSTSVAPEEEDVNSWLFHEDTWSPAGGGLFGCALSSASGGTEMYVGRTCPRQGLNGWWRMSLFGGIMRESSGDFRPAPADEFVVSIEGCVIRGAASRVAAGAWAPDCVASPYPHITPVPEPTTLALLGGGLGMLGLIGWRRRRT